LQVVDHEAMRLFAAIVPPESALLEAADLVTSVGGGTPELDPVPVDQMYVPVTHFGNVTLSDSRLLASALRADCATWKPADLRLAGGTALEWRGDRSVWLKVDGDTEELLTIGRGVPHTVQRLGFFVDRRQFRPLLAVGTVTDVTTAPYLEKLVAALEDFVGTTWTLSELSLMRRLPDSGDGESRGFEVYEQLPLGSS
jgi:RNA 2',3'-cyclic 3'-phosphodiesterase